MFFQLLKTTPYLSGQHKLDICLKKTVIKDSHKNNWDVVTDSCHLSPISDNIVYTDSIERPFFNQSYGENLKYLYSQLKDDFFRDIPAIKSKNILYEDDIWIDTTDHTYECGLKRMRYEKYHTQFSWLCPLWIENEKIIDDLYFIMTIYGDEAVKHSMKIKIKLSDELKKSLKDWLRGISSNLLYIDIEKERATITGARADTGTTVTCDVSYIIPQLFEREKPVMETNSTLNNLFSTNCMIAKQLINFNFCFSPEDIIPSHIIKEFTFKRWKVTVDAYYNDEIVEKKDFLSNYEFLPSYVLMNDSGNFSTKHNVFDYLNDDKYIDYMYLNKTTQPDTYWSLTENPEYIYNFYNGFSSWYQYIKNNKVIEGQVMGLSMTQPDTDHLEYNPQYNNIGWCKIYNYSHLKGCTANDATYAELVPIIIQAYENCEEFTRVKIDYQKVCWVDKLKFDCKKLEVPINYDFKMIMCLTGDDVNKGLYVVKITNDVYCLFVPTGNFGEDPYWKDKLTVKSLKSGQILNIGGDYQLISSFISTVFPTLVMPEKIIFKKSICPILGESSLPDTEEITYIKQEYNVKSYIFRYSGALRPYFISPNNKNYYNIDYNYKKWSIKECNEDTTGEAWNAINTYNKYLNSGYAPIFPSINYYALEGKIKDSDTGKYIYRKIDYFNYPERYDNLNNEFSWYTDGRYYVLPHTINDTFITSDNVDEAYIRDRLTNILLNKYNIDSLIAVKQINNLYDYKIDYDYASIDDINNQKFKVKYILR